MSGSGADCVSYPSASLDQVIDNEFSVDTVRFSGETLRLTGRGTVSAFYRLFAKLLAKL